MGAGKSEIEGTWVLCCHSWQFSYPGARLVIARCDPAIPQELGQAPVESDSMTPKLISVLACALIGTFGAELANAQAFTKPQVADRIRKVEDGVDEFRKYLDTRGDDARSKAQSAQNSGTTTRRRQASPSNAQSRQDQANQTKDDLEDALDDLNRSTNRLRRKFDPTSNYMETRVQMEQVMDSAGRVNRVMTRGNYGTQPQRYWAALRANINDLARCYGVTPMNV
jgi:ABC-type transporter Mla subunit MlaD